MPYILKELSCIMLIMIGSKRGRKPKSLVASIDQKQQATALPGVASPDEQKSKRGRKPKQVFLAQGDANSKSLSDDENIVLNLKVFDNDKDGNPMPDAYNDDVHDSFMSKPLALEDTFDYQPTNQNVHLHDDNVHDPKISSTSKQMNKFKVVELLKDFEEKNKQNEWPSTTSIHCYWCCHKFNNVPFGIPIKLSGNKFHVYGCFCSLECCAAYNMMHHDSVDDMWERYMLINKLSRTLGYKSFVKPAPNRLSLKAFGGHMEIEEFRQYTETNKLINVNFPPMMTLTQQIEEINETDISNDLKYIPIDTERIKQYKEKMKLKRQKPITNFRNTLDHAMNLKILT